MSVVSLTPGEVFSVRIYKALLSNPSLVWANSYEVRYNGALLTAGGPTLLENVAQSIALFERGISLPAVKFNRAVISTAVEDGQPYEPESFISVNLSEFIGLRSTDGSGVEPLDTCLLVRRIVPYGRNGRGLYRGVLQDSEVTGNSGAIAIAGGAVTTVQNLILTAAGALLDELADLDVELVMRGKPGFDGVANVRKVTGLEAVGATRKQLNNRYFDRA